jgi:hypothetical protein
VGTEKYPIRPADVEEEKNLPGIVNKHDQEKKDNNRGAIEKLFPFITQKTS